VLPIELLVLGNLLSLVLIRLFKAVKGADMIIKMLPAVSNLSQWYLLHSNSFAFSLSKHPFNHLRMETAVPGLLLYPDFITGSMEDELIKEIDRQTWVVDYNRRLHSGHSQHLEIEKASSIKYFEEH
jgi:hypothetical protein